MNTSSVECFVLCGGNASFERFVRILAGGKKFLRCTSPETIPFAELNHAVVFLLPDYQNGRNVIRELPFALAEEIHACQKRNNRFYVENYLAQDYFHKQISALQILGGMRTFHQEYLEYENTLLQARMSFYLPALTAEAEVLAYVSDCTGTHTVVKEGLKRYPVLVKHNSKALFGAAMNLSEMDVHYMRPRFRWKKLYTELFSAVCLLEKETVEKAFADVYRDFAFCTEKTQTNALSAVRKAIQWHWNSSMMRKDDGTQGMFEMIRSNDLGVRSNLRTDSTLLTAALLTTAGKKLQCEEWIRTGCSLADFLLDRNIQSPEGFFRWFDHTSMVYFSDCSRSALAMINLYKSTGKTRYLAAAEKAADAMLSALKHDGLGCGHFDLKDGFENRSFTDNPVFYGEMVCFLLQMREEKYTKAALKIIERIGAAFPEVAPFGFSDNFTYSRYLLMLSCAQYSTHTDFSEKIIPILEFFFALQQSCGGITETPIRLINHTEAGVGIGDGSDNIADLLYCNNFCFNALSVLIKLPEEKRGTLPMEKIRHAYEKLREFLLSIQLNSSDGRFDGAWMRAFDMDNHEYYGFNKDMDWGSYCIMAGWVMTFIPVVLLLEEEEKESFFFR